VDLDIWLLSLVLLLVLGLLFLLHQIKEQDAKAGAHHFLLTKDEKQLARQRSI
jgi:hypothetical protein